MRLISEDLLNDLPYEQVVLWARTNENSGVQIVASPLANMEYDYVMGEYDTPGHVRKVMRSILMRVGCESSGRYFIFPSRTEVQTWN